MGVYSTVSTMFAGLLGNGQLRNIRATGTGEIAVEIGGSNTSAFGDLNTAENTPILQYDFVYQSTPNAQLFVNSVSNGAVVDTNGGRLRITTGANAAANALHQSTKIARYRAGQGNMVRFTYVWTNNAANSTHIVGVANASIGQTATDGYFFGYNGTVFGILHRSTVIGLEAWTPKSAWNVDRCDGSNDANNPSGFGLDPTKGNVFMIRYPYLGYGDIFFYVQNPSTGRWILCHIIPYANSSASIQIANPGLSFYAQALNTGNTTSLVGYCGSVGIFLSGQRVYTGPVFGDNARLATNAQGVEKPILSLRNCTTMNGVTSRAVCRLRSITFTADNTNTDTLFRLRKVAVGALTAPTFNPTYGTTANAGVTLTSAQSIMSVDKAATAITAPAAGTNDTIFNATLARNSSWQADLTRYDLFINPGEIVSVCGTSNLANTTWSVAVNWNEDV